MCGIVGYIGKSKACPILIKGLLRQEYRGYDSAGISTIEGNEICTIKRKGRVKELQSDKNIDKLSGTVGIAHTRWATHGKPSDINAHPHSDCHNNFSIVHNGIIENYAEIRKFLINAGYTFVSDTDTAVIPNLIDYYYSKEDSSDKFLNAVNKAIKDVRGSYAISAISKFEPNRIIAIRKDNPLVVGTSEDAKYIASDIHAILEYTNNIYILKDNDLVSLTPNEITFYDKDLQKIDRKVEIIDWDAKAAEKGEYEDFMLKEISEQPQAIRETIGTRIIKDKPCDFSDINISKEYLSNVSRIYIVACGTAAYSGIAVKTIFERLTRHSSRSRYSF